MIVLLVMYVYVYYIYIYIYIYNNNNNDNNNNNNIVSSWERAIGMPGAQRVYASGSKPPHTSNDSYDLLRSKLVIAPSKHF